MLNNTYKYIPICVNKDRGIDMCIYTYTSIFRYTDMHMLEYAQTVSGCDQKFICTIIDIWISVFPVTSITSMVGIWEAGVQKRDTAFYCEQVYAVCIFYHLHVYIFHYKNLL